MSSIADYKLLGLIAGGAFGQVYRALAPGGAYVAIKVLERESVSMAVVQNEAILQHRLDHRNVLQLLKYFVTEDFFFMVSPLMHSSLDDLLKKTEEPISEQEMRRILSQIVDGIGHIHSRHILHRDIKPANILMRDDGNVKIGDFGCAKEVIPGEEIADFVGTLFFMAPEVAARVPYCYPADMWSVAVVALVLVCCPEKCQSRPADEVQGFIPAAASPHLREMLVSALQVFPESRPTAGDLTRHPWISMDE